VLEEDVHSGSADDDAAPGSVPWWSMTVACGPPPPGYVAPVVVATLVTLPMPNDGRECRPFETCRRARRNKSEW
jgi:hypothetical protein